MTRRDEPELLSYISVPGSPVKRAVFSDGTVLPVVRGGAEGEGESKPEPKPDGAHPGDGQASAEPAKTHTAADLKTAADAARDEALTELAKNLGFSTTTEIEDFVKQQRDAELSKLPELERREREVEERERKASLLDDREQKLNKRERNLSVREALEAAGCPRDDSLEVADLVKEQDGESLEAAVKRLKDRMPRLFTDEDDDGTPRSRRAPDTHDRAGGGEGRKRRESPKSPAQKATDRLQRRHGSLLKS